MLKASRLKRQRRVRTKIRGSENVPRLSVFRSNKYIYAQAIDDQTGKTIVSVSEKELKQSLRSKDVKLGKTRTEKSKALGVVLASKLRKKRKEKIIFDRGGFKYHGRVKAFAEGLREGGLKF